MIHWHYLAWLAAAVSFGLALLGYFGAGMASRQLTSEDLAFPRKALAIGVALIALTLLAGCAHNEPAIEVRTVPVPTPVPCIEASQIPAEPAQVGDRLTGDAVTDFGIVAPNALELRKWGRELMALISPGCTIIE